MKDLVFWLRAVKKSGWCLHWCGIEWVDHPAYAKFFLTRDAAVEEIKKASQYLPEAEACVEIAETSDEFAVNLAQER